MSGRGRSTSHVTSRGCSRGFILCVLYRALHYVAQQFSSRKICSFPFPFEVIQEWLDSALSDVLMDGEFQMGLGGTLADENDSKTYWTHPAQYLTWWKNNIERKSKQIILIRDATYAGDDIKMIERARYCKNAIALALNVKSYFERNIIVSGRIQNLPITYPMPRHLPIIAEAPEHLKVQQPRKDIRDPVPDTAIMKIMAALSTPEGRPNLVPANSSRWPHHFNRKDQRQQTALDDGTPLSPMIESMVEASTSSPNSGRRSQRILRPPQYLIDSCHTPLNLHSPTRNEPRETRNRRITTQCSNGDTMFDSDEFDDEVDDEGGRNDQGQLLTAKKYKTTRKSKQDYQKIRTKSYPVIAGFGEEIAENDDEKLVFEPLFPMHLSLQQQSQPCDQRDSPQIPHSGKHASDVTSGPKMGLNSGNSEIIPTKKSKKENGSKSISSRESGTKRKYQTKVNADSIAVNISSESEHISCNERSALHDPSRSITTQKICPYCSQNSASRYSLSGRGDISQSSGVPDCSDYDSELRAMTESLLATSNGKKDKAKRVQNNENYCTCDISKSNSSKVWLEQEKAPTIRQADGTVDSDLDREYFNCDTEVEDECDGVWDYDVSLHALQALLDDESRSDGELGNRQKAIMQKFGSQLSESNAGLNIEDFTDYSQDNSTQRSVQDNELQAEDCQLSPSKHSAFAHIPLTRSSSLFTDNNTILAMEQSPTNSSTLSGWTTPCSSSTAETTPSHVCTTKSNWLCTPRQLFPNCATSFGSITTSNTRQRVLFSPVSEHGTSISNENSFSSRMLPNFPLRASHSNSSLGSSVPSPASNLSQSPRQDISPYPTQQFSEPSQVSNPDYDRLLTEYDQFLILSDLAEDDFMIEPGCVQLTSSSATTPCNFGSTPILSPIDLEDSARLSHQDFSGYNCQTRSGAPGMRRMGLISPVVKNVGTPRMESSARSARGGRTTRGGRNSSRGRYGARDQQRQRQRQLIEDARKTKTHQYLLQLQHQQQMPPYQRFFKHHDNYSTRPISTQTESGAEDSNLAAPQSCTLSPLSYSVRSDYTTNGGPAQRNISAICSINQPVVPPLRSSPNLPQGTNACCENPSTLRPWQHGEESDIFEIDFSQLHGFNVNGTTL